VLVALGLPLAAILAWAFDMGHGDVRRAAALAAQATAPAAPPAAAIITGSPAVSKSLPRLTDGRRRSRAA